MRRGRVIKVLLGFVLVFATALVVLQSAGARKALAVTDNWLFEQMSAFIQRVEKVEQKVDKKWKKAATEALQSASERYLNRIAYEAANYLAGGGPGGTSLIRRESFGKILRDTSERALGDFVQTLSNESGLTKLGLNLCDPSASLKLNFSLPLLDEAAPPQGPRGGCDVSKIKKNWEDFAKTAGVGWTTRDVAGYSTGFSAREVCAYTDSSGLVEYLLTGSGDPVSCTQNADCEQPGVDTSSGSVDPLAQFQASKNYVCILEQTGGIPWLSITANYTIEEKLQTFNGLLSPQQSNLGAWVTLVGRQDELERATLAAQDLASRNCEGSISDVYGKVNKDLVVKTCLELNTLKEKTDPASAYEETLKIFSKGETGLFLNAARIFGGTLISKLMKKYIKGGSFSLSQINKGANLGEVRENIIQKLRGGAISPTDFVGNEVQNLLGETKRPLFKLVADYDYLTNMTVCPDNRNQVELENCTLDEELAEAIRDKRTVAEALASGQLRGELGLISSLNISLNSDPFCIRSGYCHSNIVRMRKYRILPIGWEIAASLSPIDRPVALRDAVNCFENGPQCPFDPEVNVFYHLIDPNWVLKAPEAECKAQVYGPKLIDVDVDERQQYCGDPTSCLVEDDEGNCISGFGYCTTEKNTWRFFGTECPAQYAGCRTFTRESDQRELSVLQSTLDTCDASQVGCKWYSLSQDNIGSEQEPAYAWNPNYRIYLNRNVEECSAEYAGCSEYISVITPGVNLVPNGDFEYFTASTTTDFSDPSWLDDANSDTFDGWQGGATAYTTRDEAFLGTVGLRLAGLGVYSTTLVTGPVADRTFTLSWYGKSEATNPGDCTADVSVSSLSAPAQNTTVTYTNEWHQFELATTFGVTNLDTSILLTFEASCTGGGGPYGIYFDGVKFELNNTSSGFSTYGEGGTVYVKSQFQCSKDDVGCDLYTPLDGGVGIPGKVDSRDSCPAECVGYQTYMQLVSKFDALESPALPPGVTYHDFIATTALSCPAQEVDCEEFTNVEEVAQGGEGREYYSFVRQCVGDALGTTYYTLEGSDTAGYQVRTWRILPSNLDFGAAAAPDFPNSSPNGGIPPCSNVAAGGDTCLDNAGNRLGTTCSAADLDTNLDCREFFDIVGKPHYLLQSRVIASSDECIKLRRTKTGVVFNALQSESRSCPAQYNGCREYRGSQANNLRVVLSSNFESGIVEPWNPQNSSISTEAVTTGGRSMTNQAGGAFTNVISWEGSPLQLQSGREVYVDLWMKNTAPVDLVVQIDTADPALWMPLGVAVESSWQVYHLGPLYLNGDVASAPVITIEAPGGGPAPQVFLDNIVIQESLSNIFVVAESWKTPASCDEPIPGAMLGCRSYKNFAGQILNLKSFSKLCSDAVVGCQPFISTHNSTNPFQTIHNEDDPSEIIVPQDSINYLVFNDKNRCFEQYKGCTEVGEPVLDRDVPEDHPKYINGYKIKYLLNDPDRYDEILCTEDGLFCEEYIDSAGANFYFKDPGNRVCVYRTNQNVEGALFTGWFQRDSLSQGVPRGCSDDNVLPYEDSDFELTNVFDYTFAGWAGECSSSHDRCTEFKDPLDTQGTNELVNADFRAPLGGSWPTELGWGNADPIPTSANSALGYAITRATPKGYVAIYQNVLDIQNDDIFIVGVEANVRQWPASPLSLAQLNLRCWWDSPSDEDYCRNTVTGSYDYTASCNQGCPVNYACTADGVASMFSAGYCKNPAGTITLTPCSTVADCTAAGFPAGSSCDSSLAFNADDRDHDNIKDYNLDVDLSRVGQWQTLRHVVDPVVDSNSKQILYCKFRMLHYTSVWDQTNTDSGGGSCADSGDSSDQACREMYCVNPANETDTNSVRCVTNVNCSVGVYTQCGGLSEVWWRDPIFQEARSYHYIDDDAIDNSSCNGQVGKRDGCLLFIDTNARESKLYDTFATYEKSTNNNGALVSPVSCDLTDTTCRNDSNRIIKVVRDRECVEWLACKSATEVFDSTTNTYRQVCDQIGACNEYQEGGTVLSCGNWVAPSKQRLEYGYYVNRSIDFDAVDYSGYSVYDHYPVGTLDIVDVSSTGSAPDGRHADYRLVRVIDVCDSTVNYDKPCGPENPLAPSDLLGQCFAPNKCVVGIDGSKFSRESDFVVTPSTRGWAEKDSPFPFSVVESDTGSERKIKFGFQQSNVCESKTQSCEFRYYKFQYGGGGGGVTKYYSADTRLAAGETPNCLCQGGLRDGQACLTENTDGNAGLSVEERCPDSGSPVYLRRTESFINWPGYCVERDLRANVNGSVDENACLTWLPVDNSPTGFDFFNQNREAGYAYKAPAYYCLEIGVSELRTRHSIGDFCDKRPPWQKCYDFWGNPTSQAWCKGEKDYHYERGEKSPSQGSCHDGTRYIYYQVPKGGDGLYPVDGDLYCVDRSDAYGDDYCEQHDAGACIALAQAVDEKGENAAMTNRFWAGAEGGAGYTIKSLGYKIEQDDTPFGSAVPQTIGIVEDEQLKIRPKQVVPRAGSPYACSSSTASCALFDKDSGDQQVSVPGWKKIPPYAGNETYVTGVARLREIFKKIFYIAKWSQGNQCNYYVCGKNENGESSVFGGLICDPNDTNACNELPNVTRCEGITNKCVNSVFNSDTMGDSLYRGCAKCLAGFVTEQSPRKRCQDDQAWTDTNGSGTGQDECETAIIDPVVGTCLDYPPALGYSCQETTPGSGSWRCFSPNDSDGNDCKIPFNTTTGTLLPQYITCQFNTSGEKTCHYDGEDTGVACKFEADCEADGNDLHAFNDTAYCADGFKEGPHDYLGGEVCVGEPFSLGQNTYIFDGEPVHCDPGLKITNGLGVELSESAICTNNGQCLPASTVVDVNNKPFCEYLPNGYLPLCNPSLQSCAGVSASKILNVAVLPLDETASSTPSFSPYIIPVVCDDNGINCRMTTRDQYPTPVTLSQVTIPNAPVAFPDLGPPYPDLGFSVNNQVTDGPQLEGHENFIASLKFYMGADKNHIPIRYIDIDWGDGSRQARVGYYKNHIEECSPTVIGPDTSQQEFLEYAGDAQACRESFRSYLHVYSYSPFIGCGQCFPANTTMACGQDLDCPAGDTCSLNFTKAASCFRPKVMIQDNWGWCTNSVYGQVGLGCTDPLVLNTTHGWNHTVSIPPEPANPDQAYIKFPGVIKIYKN